MRTFGRGSKSSRLGCETLEDRLTPALAYAITDAVTPNLISFDTAAPAAVLSSVATSGVDAGEVLVGIDFRPANGLLYGLGVNDGANTATLYTIDVATGVATRVSAAAGAIALTTDGVTAVDLPAATVGYGFDFNPSVDRVRVVAGGLNFRVNPVSGAAVDGNGDGTTTTVLAGINPDGPINGGTTTVDGTAYTNSRASTGGGTTQYTIDSTTAGNSRLFIQNPPGAGTQTVVGTDLGVDFGSVNGFDIPEGATPTTGFAVATVGGVTSLYSIALGAGTATLVVGPMASAVRGFALAPGGTFEFLSASPTAVEANGTATITLTRTGGSTGAITVTVTATAGTATAGDFTNASPYTVNFAAGELTQTFTIAILDDAAADGPKTVNLAITAVTPVGSAPPGAIGALAASTLTITDNDFSIAFQGTAATVDEAAGTATITLTRTGSTDAAVNVTVAITDATATPGDDFTDGPYMVSFAAGAATATLTIPLVDNAIAEGAETITLAITAVSGGVGVIGSPSTFTLTITDSDLAPAAFSAVQVVGNLLVIQGASVAGGTAVIEVPPGTFAAIVDVDGDGRQELVFINAQVAAAFDAQTGALRFFAADTNGDGFKDLQLFNADGTVTKTDGRTGIVVTA